MWLPRLTLGIALILPLRAQDPAPYQVSDPRITKPVILHKVQPGYSKKARRKKIEGPVQLKLIIGPDGKPKDVEVAKSLDPDLDANAIAAVQRWIFRPATKDGDPVSVYATVEVQFHLLAP
jgi:TonB family protein